MYLLPKDQYEELKQGRRSNDGVDAGGDISRSNINNIEVSKGGRIVIREGKHENVDVYSSYSSSSSDSDHFDRGKSRSTPPVIKKKRRDTKFRSLPRGRDFPRSNFTLHRPRSDSGSDNNEETFIKRYENESTRNTTPLNNTRSPPASNIKEEEEKTMSQFIQSRLSQLSGKPTKPLKRLGRSKLNTLQQEQNNRQGIISQSQDSRNNIPIQIPIVNDPSREINYPEDITMTEPEIYPEIQLPPPTNRPGRRQAANIPENHQSPRVPQPRGRRVSQSLPRVSPLTRIEEEDEEIPRIPQPTRSQNARVNPTQIASESSEVIMRDLISSELARLGGQRSAVRSESRFPRRDQPFYSREVRQRRRRDDDRELLHAIRHSQKNSVRNRPKRSRDETEETEVKRFHHDYKRSPLNNAGAETKKFRGDYKRKNEEDHTDSSKRLRNMQVYDYLNDIRRDQETHRKNKTPITHPKKPEYADEQYGEFAGVKRHQENEEEKNIPSKRRAHF
jgi:hypothetical protein